MKQQRWGLGMRCKDFMPFLDTYVDGEVDDFDSTQFEMHLQSCQPCRSAVVFRQRMKDEFRSCLSEEKAPDSLRERILDSLDEQVCESAVVIPLEERKAARNRGVRYLGWLAPVAAAIALLIGTPIFTVAPAKSGSLPIVEQAIDWHQGRYPIEVAGPDAVQVSNWFRNKVRFPVRMPQFQKDASVRLVGGRIAHVENHRAAYLLYDVDGARISILVFPEDAGSFPDGEIDLVKGREVRTVAAQGYQVALLQDSGLSFAVTSDMSRAALVDLLGSTF